MNVIVKENYDSMSAACAALIAGYINENPGKLLCFAAGDTPLGVLKKLVDMQDAGEIDLSSMYYAGLDEWVGLGYGDKGSCMQVMADNFYIPAKIPAEHMRVFDGKKSPGDEAEEVLEYVKKRGGIGLTMLGIGMNGHIGFNEPGVKGDFEGGTVELSQTSLTVGQKYFDRSHSLKYGVTLGVKTLADAKKVILIASGEKKADIVARSLKGKGNPELPASYLAGHPDYHVFLDKSAAETISN